MAYTIRIQGNFQEPGLPIERLEAYLKSLVEARTGERISRVRLVGIDRPALEEIKRESSFLRD